MVKVTFRLKRWHFGSKSDISHQRRWHLWFVRKWHSSITFERWHSALAKSDFHFWRLKRAEFVWSKSDLLKRCRKVTIFSLSSDIVRQHMVTFQNCSGSKCHTSREPVGIVVSTKSDFRSKGKWLLQNKMWQRWMQLKSDLCTVLGKNATSTWRVAKSDRPCRFFF